MSNALIDNYIQLGLLVIAVASIFSPLIVTICNNRHDYKVRKLEINSKIKQEILEKFSYYINQIYGYSMPDKLELYKYVGLLYVYFEINENLLDKLLTTDYKTELLFTKDVNKFMKSLANQVKYK